eukprot:366428-Chlamydomonas_euryale.AAC.2
MGPQHGRAHTKKGSTHRHAHTRREENLGEGATGLQARHGKEGARGAHHELLREELRQQQRVDKRGGGCGAALATARHAAGNRAHKSPHQCMQNVGCRWTLGCDSATDPDAAFAVASASSAPAVASACAAGAGSAAGIVVLFFTRRDAHTKRRCGGIQCRWRARQ